ncbi:NAD-dependent epimerase/dehydratase family protein [Chelatococcus sp. GCM10030263]|uniref:NAD-dependent epimerase/dehydratase family protein n=1 Tax=Chelatococcus sp. GCM10030263 TaxID=3273387 RepID=UPI003623D11E
MAMLTQGEPRAERVLLTGASGTLGRVLAAGLAAAGYRLILSDLVPFPDPLPEGATFAAADLTDADALAAICPEDVGSIIHFGGINTEKSLDLIYSANIYGTTHVFELAKARRARVIYASSNHTIGFYPRTQQPVSIDDPYRPDGYYGLSKAYAELLGRMFFDKHGIESIHLRIGSCLPEPTETRHLATWLSYPDLIRLVLAALQAGDPRFAVVWGISRNARRWWSGDDAARVGYEPQDDAETYAHSIREESGSAVARHFQGGSMCSRGYTRPDDPDR